MFHVAKTVSWRPLIEEPQCFGSAMSDTGKYGEDMI